MFIKTKEKYLIIIVMFFTLFHFTWADFEITEIMYDLDGTDTNREWIEVKNIGDSPEDLSKWYLFSDNTKHALVPLTLSNVPKDNYAVITQNPSMFKLDWPNYPGLLCDSSWTGLNNVSESISLKDSKLNIISPVSYLSGLGGAGDGNSLQKIDGVWVGSKPTPGEGNILVKKADEISTTTKTTTSKKIIKIEPPEKINSDTLIEDSTTINLNNLKTSIPNNTKSFLISMLPYIGLILIIVIGIVSLLIVKKNDDKTKIVDKEIRVDDIKIIE